MDLSNLLMQHMMIGQLKNYYNPNRKKQIDEAVEGSQPQPVIEEAEPEIQTVKPPTIKQMSDGNWYRWDDPQQQWIKIAPPKGEI